MNGKLLETITGILCTQYSQYIAPDYLIYEIQCLDVEYNENKLDCNYGIHLISTKGHFRCVYNTYTKEIKRVTKKGALKHLCTLDPYMVENCLGNCALR